MSYCDDCIHREVCGEEGARDEAIKFCAHKIVECENVVSRKIDEFEIKGKTAEIWIVKDKLQLRYLGVIHNIPLSSVTPQPEDLTKYIHALRKCAEEHEKDSTPTFNIRVSDLCKDTADLLESIKADPCEDDEDELDFVHELDFVQPHKRIPVTLDLHKSCGDAVSRKAVKEGMLKYGFHAPDMTVTEFVEDELKPIE